MTELEKLKAARDAVRDALEALDAAYDAHVATLAGYDALDFALDAHAAARIAYNAALSAQEKEQDR